MNTSLTPKILPKTIIQYPKLNFEAKPEIYEPVDYFTKNDFPIYIIIFLTLVSLVIILAMSYRFIKSKLKELKGVPLI